MRYVALGDSYTIGTSVSEAERWPTQVAVRVAELNLVANLGVDGATSAQLITSQLPALDEQGAELISLLVGVNDVVQGAHDAEYARNVAVILDRLVDRVGPDGVVGVAIPDYTVMPRGTEYGDPAQQSDAVLRFNAIMREACEAHGVPFVPEIFEISREAGRDRALVAADGLHPSGRQYARWVDAIAPVVEAMVAR